MKWKADGKEWWSKEKRVLQEGEVILNLFPGLTPDAQEPDTRTG